MARSTTAFERAINAALARVKPAEIKKRHIEVARQGLAGHAGPKPANVTTIVDGQKGVSEANVRAGGVIKYDLGGLAEVAAFALRRAQELSPVDSGRYRNSWFVMAGQKRVGPEDAANIASQVGAAVELIITNDQPYHRKLEMGQNADFFRGRARARLPAGIVERIRQEVLRDFAGRVSASIDMIRLRGGYTLKGRQPLRMAKQNRRSSAYRAGRKQLAARKDTAAGQQMTYPALILRAQ